jgi:hypothetical protein
MGAMADSVSGLANITKGISGVIEGIFQVMTKMFNAIMDASPLLQGMLKIVDKMFKLILMPIGNMIGRLLMPYVIKMARKTTEYLSKFGNAGPEQMADAMAEGVNIALESMIEMMMVILTKVLWPMFKGLIEGIGRVIAGLMSGQGFDINKLAPPEMPSSIGEDLQALMGNAAVGMGDIINTFGMTVQTGNRIAGNSFAEAATIFYKGSADIENGFQSVHEVLIIGTTKAIKEANDMFNLQAAGLVTIIDTVKTPFILLVEELNKIIDTLKPIPEQLPSTEPPIVTGDKGVNWGRMIAAGLATVASPILVAGMVSKNKEAFQRWTHSGHPIEPTAANGGIVTRPTRLLAGEAGPEAIIPLDKGGAYGGQTINVHFHGDVYGMDDFERKVEKTVSKYGGRVRGAY